MPDWSELPILMPEPDEAPRDVPEADATPRRVPEPDDAPRGRLAEFVLRMGLLRIAALVLLAVGLVGAVGWTAFRVVASGAAAAAYATLSDGITTRLAGDGVADSTEAMIAVADSAQAAAGDSTAADPAATVAVADSSDTTVVLAVVDSAALEEPPNPATLVGSWYHGDSRSQYGDSLTLVLDPDGGAVGHERRYGLDRTGWHATRTDRQGRWYVRYGGRRGPQLCTVWVKPTEVSACATIDVVDTIAGGPTLQFAGRHWKQERTDAAVTSAAESPRRRRPRGSGPGSG